MRLDGFHEGNRGRTGAESAAYATQRKGEKACRRGGGKRRASGGEEKGAGEERMGKGRQWDLERMSEVGAAGERNVRVVRKLGYGSSQSRTGERTGRAPFSRRLTQRFPSGSARSFLTLRAGISWERWAKRSESVGLRRMAGKDSGTGSSLNMVEFTPR